ncbi:MAG: glycosyltransferase family 4 protein [Chloroflexi bacterium]|uniref:glycosyltransferase family 4 protein n=1 Tax=Candidatus Flexifilum breve TaxID=3140694 RepID=UPI003134C330|nr:glycosyltransferase family 4 protein [Chloroflexota bacterium]
MHDLSFVRVPEAASPSLKAYLDVVVPRSVRRADHVLADSQATKDDLIALYQTPAEKITVLLSGVDARFQRTEMPSIRAKYQIPERPYILSVGTVQPRKNYARLIKALAALRASGHDVGLVIVGGKGWLEDPIYETIRSTGMTDYVRMTGFADDADLPALYSQALITALPSLYEGFGIPVLESMACGTPVLTSNVSSLPEVAGDTGIMVNPSDQDAITGALERLITDAALRAELSRRGLERAKTFTWDAAAQQLASVYRSMLG